jgi:hypothetical protein
VSVEQQLAIKTRIMKKLIGMMLFVLSAMAYESANAQAVRHTTTVRPGVGGPVATRHTVVAPAARPVPRPVVAPVRHAVNPGRPVVAPVRRAVY